MDSESCKSLETSLIERLKQGERSSFDILVNRYQQKGLNIAYNLLGNLEDARDVLQEAFIKVYLNIKDFQGHSQFSTWFYRIVVNCSIDFLRKRKRLSRVFTQNLEFEDGKEKELQIPDTTFEPATVLIKKELYFKLQDCIANLAEKQRACFVLKYQSGLNTQEISRVLKCNTATVKVHIFRAINSLRKSLSKYITKSEAGNV